MELIKVSIDKVKPYERNARKNDEAVKAVVESIKQCEYVAPIVVDENYVILAGHTRLSALKQLGYTEVEVCVKSGLTDEQKRKYRLLDNKTNEIAEWDFDLLAEELDGLDFGDLQLDWGVGDDEPTADEIVEDEVPEVDEENPPICQLGDVWQLGEHRLMCGDSTCQEQVATLLGDTKVDIAFSSPPYNAGTTATESASGKLTKYNGADDNKSQQQYRKFLNKYINCALSVSEYVFMNVQSIANNKLSLIDILYDNKQSYADTIIWDKQHAQPAMGNNVLNSVFEYIHIFSHKANRAIGTIDFRGTIDNVLHLPPQRHNEFSKIHNATFSVEFASWFVNNFAKMTVYDGFGGTGTTLIACEQLNRKCYTMELDPKYCDVIIKRWETLTGQKAVKI